MRLLAPLTKDTELDQPPLHIESHDDTGELDAGTDAHPGVSAASTPAVEDYDAEQREDSDHLVDFGQGPQRLAPRTGAPLV